jgi:tubulin delta
MLTSKNKIKKEITFDDLNSVIAHKLASVLQPANSTNNSSNKNYLNEIVADLCSFNSLKLLSLNNIPQMSKQSIEFSSYQWPGLYKNAKQLLFTGGYMDEGLNWNNSGATSSTLESYSNQTNKTIALSLFARGMDTSSNEQVELKNSYFDKNYLNKYFTSSLFGDLLNRPINLWFQDRMFNNYGKSLTLLSNSQTLAFKIDLLVDKAWRMFTSKAYVHQYIKYGHFEEESLLNSFINAEQLIKDYKTL